MKNSGWFGIAAAATALVIAITCTSQAQWQQWPKMIPTSGGQLIIYQPQIETFRGNSMTARAAVSVATDPCQEPTFGVVWFECRVDTDRSTRTVDLVSTRVTSTRFPDDTDAARLTGIIENELPRWDIDMSLDEVLTSLEIAEKEQQNSADLKNDPPTIIFSNVPAVLVVLDGEPRMQKIENTDLMRIVNTPFVIVFDMSGKTYYMKAGDVWMRTRDIQGRWELASQVPAAALALSEERSATGVTGWVSVPLPSDLRQVPQVIVATEPAELVVVEGEPEFRTIPGTSLLYVSNTDNDLFLDINTQDMYLLVAGRWFTARHKEGPWAYVAADRLPETFMHIPPSSPKGDVLASIAGTDQAHEAVADTYIPQTAVVKRSEASVTVVYDGEPRFEPVVGTTMFYAVNSPYSVVMFDGSYYCCDNAVWFVSSRPVGPWVVCDTVPTVIYTIPPSCPIYPVRYVHVYAATPEIVYVGYTPGYVGTYIYNGCVVYGTGYRYHGWYHHVYYPRPVTWGFGFRYNTYSGWSFGIGINYGGCFGVTTVNYVAGGWWGCGGFRLHDRDYWRHGRDDWRHGPDRTVIVNRTVGHDDWRHDRVANVYNRRGDIVPPHGRPDRDSHIAVPVADRGERNNVYAGRDGNVYRRNLDGWDSRQQRTWTRQNGDSPRSGHDRPGAAPATDDRKQPTRMDSGRDQTPRGGTGIDPAHARADRDVTNRMDTVAPEKTSGAPARTRTQDVTHSDTRADAHTTPTVVPQRQDGKTGDSPVVVSDTRINEHASPSPSPRQDDSNRGSRGSRGKDAVAQEKSDAPRSAGQQSTSPAVITPRGQSTGTTTRPATNADTPRSTVISTTPTGPTTAQQSDRRSDLEQQMRARVRGQERTRDYDTYRNPQTTTGGTPVSGQPDATRTAGTSRDRNVQRDGGNQGSQGTSIQQSNPSNAGGAGSSGERGSSGDRGGRGRGNSRGGN